MCVAFAAKETTLAVNAPAWDGEGARILQTHRMMACAALLIDLMQDRFYVIFQSNCSVAVIAIKNATHIRRAFLWRGEQLQGKQGEHLFYQQNVQRHLQLQ